MIRFLVSVFALSGLACQPAWIGNRPDTLAPTAVMLSERVVHHDVLNGNGNLSQWICLQNQGGGSISIVLEFEKAIVRGTVTVVDGSGEPVAVRELKPGRHTYEIFDRIGSARTPRCVVLRAFEGVSVYSLRWRFR